MKRILVVFMILLMVVTLVSCATTGDRQIDGSDTEQSQTTDTPEAATDSGSESVGGGDTGSEDYGTPVTPIKDGGSYNYGK